MRVNRRSVIPSVVVWQILAYLGSADDRIVKRGIQLLVEQIEADRTMSHSAQAHVVAALATHVQSPSVKVRRWLAIGGAHMQARTIVRELLESADRETDEENLCWIQAAALAVGLSRSGDPESQYFRVALAPGTGSGSPRPVELDLGRLGQLGLAIALGYSHARRELEIGPQQFRELVQSLRTSGDPAVREYAWWAESRVVSPSGELVVPDITDLVREPASVQRWFARAVAARCSATVSWPILLSLAQGAEDVEVREGVALALRELSPPPEVVQHVVRWFSREPESAVRLALIEHMVRYPNPTYLDIAQQEAEFAADDLTQRVLDLVSSDVTNPTSAASNPRVAILTALPVERTAVEFMFQGERRPVYPERSGGGGRHYTEVRLERPAGELRVLIAPEAGMGTNLASARATQVLADFPSVEFLVLCGIAGGLPKHSDPDRDVRLGDVVVSDGRGIVQFDHVTRRLDSNQEAEFVPRYPPRPPNAALLEAATGVWTESEFGNADWAVRRIREQTLPKWGRRPRSGDGADGKPIRYPNRRKNALPRVFLSAIGSSNVLLRDPVERDRLRDEHKMLAVEMEGAGVADASWTADARGYIVIRGIQDYCDPRKGDVWRGYAALAAAAFAAELLSRLDFL